MIARSDQLFSGRVRRSEILRIKRLAWRAPRELHRQFEPMFHAWGEEWHRLMVKQFRPAGGGSRRLRSRAGALRQSLRHRTAGGDLNSLRMRAYSAGMPYALAQEFGGVIRSNRPGGYLTIPLDPLQTKAGVTRQPSARDAIRRFGLVKKGGRLMFWRNDKGDLLLGEVRDDGTREALWLLRRQVTLPGPKSPKGGPSRLGFFRNWQRLGRRRAEQMRRATRRALQEAAGGRKR